MKRLLLNPFFLRITSLGCCLLLAAGVQSAAAAQTSAEKELATRQLFQAVYANDLAGAQASVGDGADVNARDRWGLTPADIAVDRGFYRIAHFLVSVRNIHRPHEASSSLSSPQKDASSWENAAMPTQDGLAVTSSALSPSDSPREVRPPLAPATWPAGKPNPFDPLTPAPGAQLRPADSHAQPR
jgi:hypothetical protein